MKKWIKTATLLAAATLAASAAANDNRDGQAVSSATLAWNHVALNVIERAKPTQHQAIRLLAYVSLAQYAALADGTGDPARRDAVAAASARVITGLAPAQTAYVHERSRAFGAGANDSGHRIGEQVLAEANTDGFAQMWNSQPPQAAYAWRSLANPPAPPAYPAIGGMRTFLIASGSELRAGAAPAPGSKRFADDVAEVRRYTEAPTAETTRLAKFYDMTTGTLAGGFWNERAVELIRKYGTPERQAAAVLATMNTAMLDALIACHDTKYVYWVPRPSQADPSIKPLIGVPNHPSYPSNHSCLSTAAALVLAHFYPRERPQMESIAAEAGASRIYAGLHYRFDVTAGEDIGRKVADAALARHEDMLARLTRTLLVQRTQP